MNTSDNKTSIIGYLDKDLYTISQHARERMFERNIDTNQILEVIRNGKIMEEYPDDFPCPSVLSRGEDTDLTLYVVYAICPTYLVIITAYYPDENKWQYALWR